MVDAVVCRSYEDPLEPAHALDQPCVVPIGEQQVDGGHGVDLLGGRIR
jgi:hypothetical protein